MNKPDHLTTLEALVKAGDDASPYKFSRPAIKQILSVAIEEIKELRECHNEFSDTIVHLTDENQALEQENKTLREALEEMVSIYKIVIEHHKIKGIHPELEQAQQVLGESE